MSFKRNQIEEGDCPHIGFAYLFGKQSASLNERAAHEERIHQARTALLAKFGYDLRRARPAALADARYRIIKTLPDEWLATIKSLEREWCEDEAALNEILRDRMNVQEERHPRRTRRRHGKPKQEKGSGARRSLK